MTAQVTAEQEKTPERDKTQVQRFNERMIEDLKRMKKEEQPLSDGRRRWFNREIQNLKQEIENED